MGCKTAALGAAVWMALAIAPAAAAQPAKADFGRTAVSADTRRAAEWIVGAADHRGFAFAIVDKRDAHIYVFDQRGRLRGASPVLIGQAPGDDIAPDVGRHAALGQVPFNERTTPAGRFVSSPGSNLSGEHIVWVDYESAFAIHRLRPGASQASRAARLATPGPADNRVSLGCVIVPVDFYTGVVEPLIGRSRAMVYVLPESGDLRDLQNSF